MKPVSLNEIYAVWLKTWHFSRIRQEAFPQSPSKKLGVTIMHKFQHAVW